MNARRAALPAVLALAASTACGTTAAAPRIVVSNASIRLPAGPDVTAGYLAVRNDGDRADRLVQVTAPAARQVQIHRTVDTGHGTTMRRVPSLPIPAHDTVRLNPGGVHLMLMRPHGLRAGKITRLTLRFATAGTITTTALVVGPGGTG